MALKLKLRKGSTFRKHLRWEAEPFHYSPITSISNGAPCVVVSQDHGLIIDQLFTIQAAQGLTELNAPDPDVLTDWMRATIIDKDTIEINRVNSLAFKKHTPNTGSIKSRSIVDLTGYDAELTIWNKVGGDVLDVLSVTTGEIEIDLVSRFIKFTFTDEMTLAYDWKKGVYDLDLISSSGDRYTVTNGEILIEPQ